jgi:hypothetical protein
VRRWEGVRWLKSGSSLLKKSTRRSGLTSDTRRRYGLSSSPDLLVITGILLSFVFRNFQSETTDRITNASVEAESRSSTDDVLGRSEDVEVTDYTGLSEIRNTGSVVILSGLALLWALTLSLVTVQKRGYETHARRTRAFERRHGAEVVWDGAEHPIEPSEIRRQTVASDRPFHESGTCTHAVPNSRDPVMPEGASRRLRQSGGASCHHSRLPTGG